MARVQNTLIGKSSGSVGGATFSTWKGINVLKSKAITVANPKTVGQLTQRNRMTLMVSIFRLIAGAINTGFKTLAIGKSEYNAFISENIQDATIVGVAPAVDLSPINLKVSKGTMGETPISSITAEEGSLSVDIEFNSALAPLGSNANDIAYGVVYNATKNEWAYGSGSLRSTGKINVTMSTILTAGDVLHYYLFFKSFGSDEVSDSTYGTYNV